MAEPSRVPAPWTVVEHNESFEIRAANGQPIAYLYFEDEPVRQRTLKRLTKDEARRIAAAMAKLPDLVRRGGK